MNMLIKHHFGEGKYEEAERIIGQLLEENGRRGFDRDPVSVNLRGLEVAASGFARSSETYLGYERGDPRVYAEPIPLQLNDCSLLGNWSIAREAAVLNEAGGRIAYRFHARDVNLVMGPERLGNIVRFRVSIDGRAPGDDRGDDVDAAGNGTVKRQDAHQLIRQRGPIVDRLFEIEFHASGVEAFDFTFG